LIRLDRKTVGIDREKIRMIRRAIHITTKTNRAGTNTDRAMIRMDCGSKCKPDGRLRKTSVVIGYLLSGMQARRLPPQQFGLPD